MKPDMGLDMAAQVGMAMPVIHAWRHPRPEGAAGLCVGARCDLDVHPRRAKRLARRIQAHARRHRLPHVVWTSPLRRCAAVGEWLRRWGWVHHRDAALAEIDFGAWDGRPWSRINKAEVDAWVADFAHFAPEGGEPLVALLRRAAVWRPEVARGMAVVEKPKRAPGNMHGEPTGKAPDSGAGALVVSHGGWMLARRWAVERGWRGQAGTMPADLPQAAEWPVPPRYSQGWAL